MPRATMLAAALAAAFAASPDAVEARQSPLPPGACVTAGEVGIPYEVGVNCRTVEVDGFPRRFEVYIPRTRPTTGVGAPVVFMFHGSSGDGEKFLRISGWREQSDAVGAISVYPTAVRYRIKDNGRLSTKWNDGTLRREVDLSERPDDYPLDAPWPANDVGFVDAIVADLEAQLPVDRRRIYASGFSNGAGFTARLAVERSTVFAAATMVAEALERPRPIERPIPMYLVAGAADPKLLAHVGLPELPLNPLELLTIPFIEDAVEAHLDTLGLDPADFGSVRRTHSTSLRWPAIGTGADGALFRFAVLEGLRHNYPNAHNNPAGFEAAPEFWKFLEDHPLPN
jgi:polyhydroxybutyrate depolymerase